VATDTVLLERRGTIRGNEGMTYIEELRAAILLVHKAQATHIESVPVKESFQGKTVWDGIVEVFELHGHPKASKVYAWAHDTDDPERPRIHVTVLHCHPITSAKEAVRAALVQEFRNFEPAES
jgi:hypothetical protein